MGPSILEDIRVLLPIEKLRHNNRIEPLGERNPLPRPLIRIIICHLKQVGLIAGSRACWLNSLNITLPSRMAVAQSGKNSVRNSSDLCSIVFYLLPYGVINHDDDIRIFTKI